MKKQFLDLSIEQHPQGDWNLRQERGPCDDESDHWIIVTHEHVACLAAMAGFISEEEAARREQGWATRLHLLGGLVRSHCPVGHPLRVAAGFLVGDEPEDPVPSQAPVAPLSATPSAAMPRPPAPPHGGQQLELEA